MIETCAKKGGLAGQMIDRYKSLVQKHPNNSRLHNYFGNALLLLDPKDKNGKAKQCYEKALNLEKEYSSPLNNLAIIAFRNGSWDLAENLFNRYLNSNQHDAECLSNLGILYTTIYAREKVRKNTGLKAEKVLSKSIALDPANYVPYKTLGYLLYLQGKKEESLAAYEKSLLLRRGQEDILSRVERLKEELGEPAESEFLWDEMATRGSFQAKSIHDLTSIFMHHLQIGEFEMAAQYCQELCHLLPSNYMSYRMLGHVYEQMGMKEEAEKYKKKSNEMRKNR